LIVPRVGKELLDGKGSRYLAMFLADLLSKFSLAFLEVFRISAQRPHGSPWQAATLARGFLADLIERLATKLHNVEAVEAKLRISEMLSGCCYKRFGHVQGNFVDPCGWHSALLELGGEFHEGFLALAWSEEQQPDGFGSAMAAMRLLAGDFQEYRAVFVALAGGSFIYTEALQGAPISLLPRLIDPAADQKPDAILADAGLPRDLGNREKLGHHQQMGFHQLGEPAIGPRPRHLEVFDRSRRGLMQGTRARIVVRFSKKPRVFPALLNGVVNGTELAGIGIGKACATLEINNEFQGLGGGNEIAGYDPPWGCQS